MRGGTFTITVGIPGSGKSTFADRKFAHALRLERDRMREALFGSRIAYHQACSADPALSQPLSYLVGSTMARAMRTALDGGIYRDVILSDTGVVWDSVKRFWRLARDRHMRVNVVYFDVPWDTLQERNATRSEEHRLPEDVLKRFFRLREGLPMGDEVNERWWLDPNRVNSLIVVNEFGEQQR